MTVARGKILSRERIAGSPLTTIVCAGLLSLAIAGCHAVPDAQPSGAAAEVRAARLAQNAAIVARDADAVAQFWTDDVEIRRGFGALVTGKQAYRQLFAEDTSDLFERTPQDIEVSANWPLAFETGTWSWHVGSITAPAIVTGRYSAQWVRRGGRWLIRGEVYTALHCAGEGCSKQAVP